MATMPSPMKMPLRTRRSGDAPWRLMTKKAPPVTTIATTSERGVNPMSYDNGIGTTTASMPMKCIDHTPPPITIAAATSHTRRASPRAAPTCPPRSRAVYDAKEATRMDRATRYGLYVPVTTIGIAPILGPEMLLWHFTGNIDSDDARPSRSRLHQRPGGAALAGGATTGSGGGPAGARRHRQGRQSRRRCHRPNPRPSQKSTATEGPGGYQRGDRRGDRAHPWRSGQAGRGGADGIRGGFALD